MILLYQFYGKGILVGFVQVHDFFVTFGGVGAAAVRADAALKTVQMQRDIVRSDDILAVLCFDQICFINPDGFEVQRLFESCHAQTVTVLVGQFGKAYAGAVAGLLRLDI